MRHGRRTRERGVIVACLGIGLLGAGLALWLGVFPGPSPHRVVLVYVREENSLGLAGIPAESEAARVGLVVAGEAAILPRSLGRIPAGTKVIVLRETFVAGLLVESRATFLRRLPGLVAAREDGDPAGSVAARTGTLLAADLEFVAVPTDQAEEHSGDAIALSLGLQGGANPTGLITLAPGQEWRIGAVARSEGPTDLMDPAAPGYEAAVREAFRDGRAVSVLSVLDLGYWDTDRILSAADPPTD